MRNLIDIIKQLNKSIKKARYLFLFIFFVSTAALLATAIKGEIGDPIYHQTPIERNRRIGSPFESSGSTSRYALTEAIVENQTFFFTEKQARFSAPDFVEYKERFFSIFTPGVSFLGIPFYLVGKIIGLPQLFTYLSTIIFAIFNLYLVAKIAKKFGAGKYAALLSGFIFLFTTNALSYAPTYTQHHLAATIILLAFLNLFGKRTLGKNIYLGMLFGMGLLIDLPNGLMMFPIIVYALLKHLSVRESAKKAKLSLKLNIIGLVIGLIPFLAFFGWYNYQLTGSYTKIGQMIGRSDYFEPPEIKEKHRQETKDKELYDVKFPLNTRNQLNGLYILLVSNERGWIYYSPIVVIGILGLLLAYKNQKKRDFIIVAIAVVLISIVTYSMFGAWGGWAFGPRYLIPAAALLCSAVGTALQRLRKNIPFAILFFILSIYSLGVNIVGVMTTTQVPPKVEAVNLPNPIPYTYKYNLQLMQEGKSSSLIYNLFLSDKITAQEFSFGYFTVALSIAIFLYRGLILEKRKGKLK